MEKKEKIIPKVARATEQSKSWILPAEEKK